MSLSGFRVGETSVRTGTTWSNWSGNVTWAPQSVATPGSEAELVKVVQKAHHTNATVRAAGTGHSFTPLCATDEVLISLEGLQGVVSVDPQAMTATVWAGTRLSRLTELLFAEGIALENQGDIDLQSVAGAISTGTHGTGRGIGSISTQVEDMRLVLASGDIMDVSEESNPKTL